MEAHRLGLGGAVQCGALAGRMQDVCAASGKLQEQEAQPPALPEVLYGSSAAASPMPLQRLLEPNKQTAARQPHPAHLGAGHLRHNACQRLTLLSCHQVQGIQELQQAFECARSRLHYCKVQGQASAPCSP